MNQAKEQENKNRKVDAPDWRLKADQLWDGTSYTAPQKAINYLDAALEIRPDWPEAFNDRGLARLDDYQLDNAMNDFTAAIALKNDFAEAYHNRGVALLRAGKRFAAKKDFQAAAGLGLWMGLNAMQMPVARPGLLEKIKRLLRMNQGG